MKKTYEAPELTQIGSAEEVVLGFVADGGDLNMNTSPDFEFEQD